MASTVTFGRWKYGHMDVRVDGGGEGGPVTVGHLEIRGIERDKERTSFCLFEGVNEITCRVGWSAIKAAATEHFSGSKP